MLVMALVLVAVVAVAEAPTYLRQVGRSYSCWQLAAVPVLIAALGSSSL